MSTALSWTELRASRSDLAALLAFRSSGLATRARTRLRVVAAVVGLLTVAVVLGPAYLGGPQPRDRSGTLLALLPTMALGFLVLASLTAVASAGGREVVPRDQAVAFPVSTTTDHLGALLLAPLNIAWLLQGWTLLGSTSYALGPRGLPSLVPLLVLWIAAATALAQVLGWAVEGVRRGAHGILVVRLLGLLLVVATVVLVVGGHLAAVLDHSPTRMLLDGVLAGVAGDWWTWSAVAVGLVVVLLAAVVVGAVPAAWALHRPMREELRLEGGRHQARSLPRSDLAMMLRVDRGSVWRSVPLRRGLFVLAVMPGAVALAGDLEWSMLTVLPGLVASGAALLFGVNTWCLDGRGSLWRHSLPVSSRVSFASRALVLAEVLLGAALVTLALAALRAGAPSPSEAMALGGALLVVTVQVVGAGMRWSIARPFAVDLRSARATPAPPVVMAGYSARLALTTTVTGLVFTGLAEAGSTPLTLLVSLVMLLWSAWRIERTAQRWDDPVVRSRVVAVVSGA